MSRKVLNSKYLKDTKGWIDSFQVETLRSKPGLLLLLLLLAGTACFAQQSRKDLEDKRKKLLKEIEQTSTLLKQTKEDREATFSRYVTLQKQISKRQQLIETLQAEKQFLQQSMERSIGVVEALNEDVGKLKEEYTNMARHAYRQHLKKSDLLFLISSKSFNDAFQRWQYLKQYDRYRQKQAHLILDTQLTLMAKIKSLEDRRIEKEQLLASELRHSEMLGLELTAKNRLLEDLKGDEAQLAHELEVKRTAAQKLSNAIESIIKAEMERTARATASAANKTSVPSATPEAVNLSRDFQNNQGRLPWPVKNGVITSQFGRQPHPAIKTVEITNNGIDIRTDVNSPVLAVFGGTVVGTQFVPGYDYMVILQHGNYYTVYSNLEEVKVRKGDSVKIRQTLGIVSTDRKTSMSEVHFEIWKDKTRLNPQDWVGSN